jgi:hypothetical protein
MLDSTMHNCLNFSFQWPTFGGTDAAVKPGFGRTVETSDGIGT